MTEAIRQGDIPGVQLRCRADLAAAPHAAWRLLTDPRGLERWLCEEAEMPAAAGGDFRWTGCAGLEPGTVEEGTILDLEAPRVVLARTRQPTWSAFTRLRIDLEPTADGCEISVLQNGFEHLPLSLGLTVWELYRRRWRAVLAALREIFRESQRGESR
ncbi:MAG: SRPBCC domain-containing protein [Acidobacteriota bacterium]|nr:SRPBCC domain-containing protein [Acidobacteriota bacterium]MDH3523513.1 SRPBCC domain-containing protein [Acidobacteriota bacterium]